MPSSYTIPKIDDMLQKLEGPGGFAAKDAVWARVRHTIEAPAQTRPRRPARKPLRVAVLAAVIFVLTATAVTAAIGRMVAGKLSVELVDHIETLDNGAEVVTRLFYPGEQPFDPEAHAKTYTQKAFTTQNVGTAQAARDILPFPFKAPTWAPEGYLLSEVNLRVGELGLYEEAVSFGYYLDTGGEAPAPGSLVYFYFDARYVGPEARIEIESTGSENEVRFLKIGENDAVILPVGGLCWIDDGVVYSLSTTMGEADAIRMAESLA